jgi:LPXTG-motif cell wall-anchored protein
MWSRRAAGLAGVACLALAAGAPVAAAQDDGGDDPKYPPTIPTAASGVCVGDVPYFQYAVDFGDPSLVGNTMTITFVNPNGDSEVITTTVPAAGETATVLWPGASVDPPDWPGWDFVDGTWVPTTTDRGAYTRAPGGVTVVFETNPTLSSTVTYPPASAICANPVNENPPPGNPPPGNPPGGPPGNPPTSTPPGGLPQTGAAIGSVALLGGGLIAAGTAAVAVSRRRRG